MTLRALVVFATVTACSSSSTSPSGSPGTDAGSDAASTGLPPTSAITVTACEAEGFPTMVSGFDNEVTSLHVHTDGALYALIKEGSGKLVRYKPATGAACKLTKDTSFGVSGAMEADSFAVDASGKVYTYGGFKSFIVHDTNGKKLFECEAPSPPYPYIAAVVPDGSRGYLLRTTESAHFAVTISATSCTMEAWSPKGDAWPTTDGFGYVAHAFADRENLYVGAQTGGYINAHDGTQRAKFGGSEFGAADSICYSSGMVVAKDGIDIADGNCAAIRRFDKAGKFIGAFDPDALKLPTPRAMAIAPDGKRYVVARDTGGPQALYRVEGL